MYVAFVTIKCKSVDYNMSNRFLLEFEATSDTMITCLNDAIVAWLVKFDFAPNHMTVEIHDVFEASKIVGDFSKSGESAVSSFSNVFYKRK